MKKLALVAAVVACASIVSAQTVTSQNIVGYTKVQGTAGALTLCALNFDTGGLTLNDLFADLNSGSYIHYWNKGTGSYQSALKGRGGFSPNLVMNLGDAFWIEAANTTEITLPGEVLLAETNTVNVVVGVDATGFYYPVETLWSATALSADLSSGDYLHVWNGTGYNSYLKGRGGWSGDPTIGVAEGFWVESANALTSDQPRPFTP
jgi:hypothetical protein